VLLKLSSKIKFSQSLNWYEDDSNGTTSLVYVQPQLATYITFGVGYCFIRTKGNARSLILG
jgi:hypothetical protein